MFLGTCGCGPRRDRLLRVQSDTVDADQVARKADRSPSCCADSNPLALNFWPPYTLQQAVCAQPPMLLGCADRIKFGIRVLVAASVKTTVFWSE
jgi:hypothetical protein